MFMFLKLIHIKYLSSLRTADLFPVVASLPPKITSANPTSKTISVTWNLLFWCWPIRSKERIQLEWLLASWHVLYFGESYQTCFGTTGILQAKENTCNIAPRLVIYLNLTSADKSWWTDCRHILDGFKNLWQSLVNNSNSYWVSPRNNEQKYYKSVSQTRREINIYSSKLIIVKMTFQLRRSDSSYKKLWKLKPWKEH